MGSYKIIGAIYKNSSCILVFRVEASLEAVERSHRWKKELGFALHEFYFLLFLFPVDSFQVLVYGREQTSVASRRLNGLRTTHQSEEMTK